MFGGTFSIWHWLIVLVVVLLLFGGRGKIPSLMADVAKGIKSFKTSMKDDKEGAETAAKQIDAEPVQAQAHDKTAKS